MTTKSESNAAKVLGRKGGRAKSEAKAAASRENGKRGGRPPKVDSQVRDTCDRDIPGQEPIS